MEAIGVGWRAARPSRSSPAIEIHYEKLTAFVRRKVRCPALATDIVQETCMRHLTVLKRAFPESAE